MSYNFDAMKALETLGLGGTKRLPIEGTAAHVTRLHVLGKERLVTVMVRPKSELGGRKGQRLMAFCPVCSKLVAFGRLWQHARVHKEALQ